MEVYTDGSSIIGPDGIRYGGCGIWFGKDSCKNTSIPLGNATNQYAELMALNVALRLCKNVPDLTLFTDSMYSINCIITWYSSWEKNGWKTSSGNNIFNLDVIKQCRNSMDTRKSNNFDTSLLYVKAHSTSEGNNGADTLAKQASLKSKNTAMNETIFFDSGILSQFYPSTFMGTVEINKELKFTCSEQWYQYMKAYTFGDMEIAEKIYDTGNPGYQKILGNQVKGFDEHAWKSIRENIVIQGNVYKFSQNDNLKTYLISTHNKRLVKARIDPVWGIGISKDHALRGDKWKGDNLLGKCIMKVRSQLM